jgi:hypothetical protein|tara:strand:+ start:903 stop:1145 length:243 start_codon:yes stop_codon:yes gene_type:complete
MSEINNNETKVEETNPVAKAKAVIEELRQENTRREEILKREEEITARNMLSGQSSAGQVPAQTKEETPKEYAQRIMEGRK